MRHFERVSGVEKLRRRIGGEIRLARQALDLEVQGLAALVGVTASTMSNIELGKHGVGFELLAALEVELGVLLTFVPAGEATDSADRVRAARRSVSDLATIEAGIREVGERLRKAVGVET